MKSGKDPHKAKKWVLTTLLPPIRQSQLTFSYIPQWLKKMFNAGMTCHILILFFPPFFSWLHSAAVVIVADIADQANDSLRHGVSIMYSIAVTHYVRTLTIGFILFCHLNLIFPQNNLSRRDLLIWSGWFIFEISALIVAFLFTCGQMIKWQKGIKTACLFQGSTKKGWTGKRFFFFPKWRMRMCSWLKTLSGQDAEPDVTSNNAPLLDTCTALLLPWVSHELLLCSESRSKPPPQKKPHIWKSTATKKQLDLALSSWKWHYISPPKWPPTVLVTGSFKRAPWTWKYRIVETHLGGF